MALKGNGIDQRLNEIVDIAYWPVANDYGVFPVGARDKTLRISPRQPSFEFCISNHRYLFKEAIKSAQQPGKPRHPDQYWAEVIAYKVACLMDVPAPRVFVAVDSEGMDGIEPGTINEWFMGYSQEDERFIAGGDFMQRMIRGYDREKGKAHNLRSIIQLARTFTRQGLMDQDWVKHWALGLCFDALIGNTDRHQENWGLIVDSANKEPPIRFAPFFDNGTSLGHELREEKMKRMMRDQGELEAYLRRGCHHMKADRHNKKRMSLIDGTAHFCGLYPRVKEILLMRLKQFQDDKLGHILETYSMFNMPQPLTQLRADFVLFLVKERKIRLIQALEK